MNPIMAHKARSRTHYRKHLQAGTIGGKADLRGYAKLCELHARELIASETT